MRSIPCHISPLEAYLCVRETERKIKAMLFLSNVHLNLLPRKACGLQHSHTSGRLCKKREDIDKYTPRSSGKLAALPIGNNRQLQCVISSKLVFVCRSQVFWVVALCDWVISSRFEGKCYFHFQGHEHVNHAVDTSNHCFRIVINIFISDVNYLFHLPCRVDARLIFYERMKRQKVSLHLDASLHEHIIILLQKVK